MLRKRRKRAKDRLTVRETIGLDDMADATAIDEWNALVEDGAGGLEWRLRQVEQFWQTYAAADQAIPEEYSRAWYAREIRVSIDRVRRAYAAQSLESLAIAAFQVGRLHEEGRWRHAFMGVAKYARNVRAKNIRAGRRRGRDARAEASERDRQLVESAHRLRQRHPYGREYPTRWLARKLARGLHQPPEGVRARLNRLGLK